MTSHNFLMSQKFGLVTSIFGTGKVIRVSSTHIFGRSAATGVVGYATDSNLLRAKLEQLIPQRRRLIEQIKADHGSKVLGSVTVDMAYNGMRGVKGLIYETSLLDPEEVYGIRYRGLSIPQCRELLPKAPDGGTEPLPEGVFWLLLTGEIPTTEQVEFLSNDWLRRTEKSKIPAFLWDAIDSFPPTLHPMSQLSAAILLLQSKSEFARQYQSGNLKKQEFWIPLFEDINDLIAILPYIASRIYRNVFKNRTKGLSFSMSGINDWGGRLALSLGLSDKPLFLDLMRLYLSIHADHEGGNVSAHTVNLVGSSLSDPYLAFSAGLNGLAGPLHGLANQEVLEWLLVLKDKLGDHPTDKQVEDYIWSCLNSGHVIPGYGHAVLRKTDPRYLCQREFALKHLPDDPLFKITSQLYKIAPKVLSQHGKTKNPWPNVDAHSGVLLQHYGLVEKDFYTVLFGISRAIGSLSGLLWSRALLFPIERPKSLTSEAIANMFAYQDTTVSTFNN